MDKFNRFLEPGEELLAVASAKTNHYRIFVVYFFIFVAFFSLYPLFLFGRQSLFIWLSVVVILFLFLSRNFAAVYDSYLLTDRRIIFLQAVSKDYHKKTGYLALNKIRKVISRQRHSIYVYSTYDRYHLQLQERDRFLAKLKKHLNLP